MAEVTGLVTRINWLDDPQLVQVRIGAATDVGTSTLIHFTEDDTTISLAWKRAMITLLSAAQRAGWAIRVVYSATDDKITSVNTVEQDISPCGPAIRGDLYSVSGSGFPTSAHLEFESASRMVDVTPDLARPHLLVVEQLPDSVPLGRCTVRVVAPGYASDRVTIDVSRGKPQTVRVLHSGPPTPAPYTIALVASPAIRYDYDDSITPDDINTDPVLYAQVVIMCLTQLFAVAEDLLTEDNIDQRIRLVTVRDPARTPTEDSALVEQVVAVLRPRRPEASAFLSAYDQNADLIIAMSSSYAPTASANSSIADQATPGTPATFDGLNVTHYEGTLTPGAIAMPGRSHLPNDNATTLHEFGHAFGPPGNTWGHVSDLYVDDTQAVYPINQRLRATPESVIPEEFGELDGTTYLSDQDRDYGVLRQYNPQRRNNLPNIMTNTGKENLFDYLTRDFLKARLIAKTNRRGD
ncbi:MAG: hypothetical protein WA892_01385 [Ornithinimicrobium sp.]